MLAFGKYVTIRAALRDFILRLKIQKILSYPRLLSSAVTLQLEELFSLFPKDLVSEEKMTKPYERDKMPFSYNHFHKMAFKATLMNYGKENKKSSTQSVRVHQNYY